MKSYKIESYVPEKDFLLGKDARFCRTAFEDAFVIDLDGKPSVIASLTGKNCLDVSMADAASLLTLFCGDCAFLLMPSSRGTLLIYPAWKGLGFGLAFLFGEDVEKIEKTYQNAQRYAFSTVFGADSDTKINQQLSLENKLSVLHFYMTRLFGESRETNAAAHVLMLANLFGCRLHETSLLCADATLDERELEKFDAFLSCVFMTMRRYNGEISAAAGSNTSNANLMHVSQEYGVRIQQSLRKSTARNTSFGCLERADVASFAEHPAFKNYQIEESDGTFRLYIPLKKKAHLSSLFGQSMQKELIITLIPLH